MKIFTCKLMLCNFLVLLQLLLLLMLQQLQAQQQQNPMELNGGCCLAMAGDRCVAVVTDNRFGSGPQMVNVAPRKVFVPHASLIVGFAGLHTDIQALSHELENRVKNKITHGSLIEVVDSNKGGQQRINSILASSSMLQQIILPNTMSRLTSHVLYSRRASPYYVEPLIAGLVEEEEQNNDGEQKRYILKPFLCAQDIIGAESRSDRFVCVGVASKSLYGTAEAFWKPNLSPEELVEVCGKAFLSALERDCLSGYGAMLYLITEYGIDQIELACRND